MLPLFFSNAVAVASVDSDKQTGKKTTFGKGRISYPLKGIGYFSSLLAYRISTAAPLKFPFRRSDKATFASSSA